MFTPRKTSRRNPTSAFTLIELLVVISIIGILIAVSTPYMMAALQANRLTTAGEEMLFKISLAQQAAISENRPVEMRFYLFTEDDAPEALRAYQLFEAQTDSLDVKALENPVYFGNTGIVGMMGSLSPLFSVASLGNGWPKPAESQAFADKGASYYSILFYPDGSTNIRSTLKGSYLTLVGEADQTVDTTPPNFYTIQIDPVTGRAKSYRPN